MNLDTIQQRAVAMTKATRTNENVDRHRTLNEAVPAAAAATSSDTEPVPE